MVIVRIAKIVKKDKPDIVLDCIFVIGMWCYLFLLIRSLYTDVVFSNSFLILFIGLGCIGTYYILKDTLKDTHSNKPVLGVNSEQAEDILYLYDHIAEIKGGKELLKVLSLFVQDNLNQSFDLNQCPIYQTALTRIIQHQNTDKIKQIKFWLEEQFELNSLNLFSKDEIKKYIDDFINTINQEEKIDMEKEKQRFIGTIKYEIINNKLNV